MTSTWIASRPSLFVAFAAWLIIMTPGLHAGDWKIDTVDGGGTATFTSLRIDTAGNVHVAYVVDDGNIYPLKYAFWDDSIKRWFTMTLAEGVSTCALALDSKERPHISYVDYGTATGSKLRYARWDGKIWKRDVIPLASEVIAYYTSIAFDANDAPSITFYEYRGPRFSDFKIRLRMVSWNGSNWDLRTIDSSEGSGKFNSIAIDAKGTTHIAYGNVSATTAGLRYAYGQGKSWKLEIVDDLSTNNGGVVGHGTILALDKDGDPHVCYMDVSNSRVKYAAKKNGRWNVEVVDRLSGTASNDRNGITVDEQRRAYLGYHDPGHGLLKVAWREGERWVTDVVDGNGAGFTSSLQFHRGVLWISYGARDAAGLKVARLAVRPEVSSLPKAGREPTK